MIDRDKDPCGTNSKDVVSQRQVTGHDVKEAIEKHEDFMKASFLDPEPRRGVFSPA